MVLEYPSTCVVELPLSATAFYNLSQAPPFCSFVAEVTPLPITMRSCTLYVLGINLSAA